MAQEFAWLAEELGSLLAADDKQKQVFVGVFRMQSMVSFHQICFCERGLTAYTLFGWD